ncbi:glycosyltransferase family 4 protein [Desulfococcaceae bacterium HSG7]|nr:glycosyltransferase family 4 protein [Desulfococcaceae bacterium HSG7]
MLECKKDKNLVAPPLKILHLISSRGLYGAERIVINLIAAMDHRCFVHQLALLRVEKNPNIEFIEAVREKQAVSHIVLCRKWIDMEALRQVRKLIKQERIDIVHCHEMKGRLYGLLATIGTKTRIITTNHNWIRSDFLVSCFESMDAFYIRFFPKIIAVSPEVQKLMCRYLVPDKKIQVIINGIDMNEFQQDKAARNMIRKELGINRNISLIGAFGRISPEKGQKYLIAAAVQVLNIFPEARFLIVGDGFQGEEMKEYATCLGISDRVIFAGFRKNISEFYSALDLFVLPSILEGTPMALLEAMSAKTPVIATRVGGVGRIIQNRKNGLLVSPANSEELAGAIIRLLQNSAEAKNLAKNALCTVSEKYSSQKMADEYIRLYTELTS